MANKFAKLATKSLQSKLKTANEEDKKLITSLLEKRLNKTKPIKPKKGLTVTFVSHIGKKKIDGEIIKTIKGTDGLPYHGVIFEDKIWFKQERYITVVQ